MPPIPSILIKKSPTADTRSCDPTKVSKSQLIDSTLMHIADVGKGIALFVKMLTEAASRHDYDKLSNIDQFHADFVTRFKDTFWWDNHRKIHRHHLNASDGIPEDVNLVDVLEYIADCVMAGKARTGTVYDLATPDNLLQRAFENTVKLLTAAVEVEEPEAFNGFTLDHTVKEAVLRMEYIASGHDDRDRAAGDMLNLFLRAHGLMPAFREHGGYIDVGYEHVIYQFRQPPLPTSDNPFRIKLMTGNMTLRKLIDELNERIDARIPQWKETKSIPDFWPIPKWRRDFNAETQQVGRTSVYTAFDPENPHPHPTERHNSAPAEVPTDKLSS